MFFLKAETGRDGVERVRVYAELENGFVGLADESVKQAKPHLWTAFSDGLKAFGHAKAEKLAKKEGEFRLPEEPRSLGLVERELDAATAKLKELEAEHKKALKESIEREELAAGKVEKEEKQVDDKGEKDVQPS